MKLLTVLFFISTALLLFNNCDSTDPKLEPELLLKLEEVSCTEAWLQLKTTNLQLPNNVTLFINDLQERTFNLTTADTLLYIDSLLPNQNYSFQLISFYNPEDGVKSNKVPVTTLDTTSHNFTFETFTFGQHSSSVLYDVAIIDENNIWAVGEIYMNDSLGNPDPTSYNAVHWNGQSWELKRIKTNSCGGVDYPPIKTIFAFSMNDILFAHIDGSISYFNGIEFTNDCSLIIQVNGSANKMWGLSKNNFYVVSGNGFIAHYQNGTWTKIESGTTLDLKDISSDRDKVWLSGYSNSSPESIILKLNNGSIINYWFNQFLTGTSPYGVKTYSLQCIENDLFIASNEGAFRTKLEFSNVTSKLYTTAHRVYKICGTKKNNIYTLGDWSVITHYNGVTSKRVYFDFNSTNILYSGTATGDIVVGVGVKVEDVIFHKGLLVMGKKL